jgi:hypothetical protein
MFNLVAINLPNEHRHYASKCHKEKCHNEGRYQIFADIDESGLPDWEGKAICSFHLVQEARLRPEIILSLIDMMIDAMEQHHLFAEAHAPEGGAARQVLTFPRG